MTIFLLIWLLFAIASAIVASQKHRSAFGWFLLGVLLGPFGLIFALIVAPQNQARTIDPLPRLSRQDALALQTKQCTQCAELIKFEAKKCRYCGEVFDPDQVASEVAEREALFSASDKFCPYCRRSEVIKATLPDGGFGPWCPNCKRPVPRPAFL